MNTGSQGVLTQGACLVQAVSIGQSVSGCYIYDPQNLSSFLQEKFTVFINHGPNMSFIPRQTKQRSSMTS